MFRIIIALVIFGGLFAISIVALMKSNKEAARNNATNPRRESPPASSPSSTSDQPS